MEGPKERLTGMIDFSIPDDERLVVASIRKFIEREVLPWEPVLIQRGLRGEPEYLSRDEEKALQLKAKAFGYWGLDTPEPYGGADLTPVVQALIWMELGRTFVPFRFGGSANNVLFDLDEQQRHEYLLPTLAGDRSCA